MITYQYKLQGNGKDSWIVTVTNEQGEVIEKYMTYENPNKKTNISNIDIDSITEEDLTKLAQKLKKYL